MSVHWTKDGRCFVAIPKGRHPLNPSKTREYFGRGPEAEKKAIAFNESLGLGGNRSKQQGVRFSQLVNEYYFKNTNLAPTTITGDEHKVKAHILPYFGARPYNTLTFDTLDGYVQKRIRQGVTKSTIHRELCIVRAVLNWCVNRNLIVASPMQGYILPKRDDARIMPPSNVEMQALLKHAAPHMQRFILLAYNFGCRPGAVELLSLTWDKVNLEDGFVFIESADKGGAPLRAIPIVDPAFLDLLKKWKEDDHGKTEYLVSFNNRPINKIKTAWRSAKKKAGITRRLRPYDLRHKSATDMLERGVPTKIVAEILGNDPATTMKYYQHVNSEMKQNAVNSLGKFTSFAGKKDE